MTQNINGDDDPFNRYKMPRVSVQQLADNTTIFTNIDQVAKSLGRTSEEIFRALQKELHTRCNTKKNTINGQLTRQELQEALQKYINTDVLCKKCGNPETIHIKQKIHCKACGHIRK